MKTEVIASIANHLKHEGVNDEITAETLLTDLNIDSLGLYSMVAGVEDDFDVMIEVANFSCSETVGDVADAVIAKLNDRCDNKAKAA